ncbi:DUF1549 domain-containing protein, partial [Singulisphaera acidiphila]
YVIDAFNHDKPYDQFIREQVAGDLIAATTPANHAELVTATGFIATSRRFGFDPQNYQHLTIQDTIDTVGQAVLGLSLGCARCHDHKFDPISAADYYALYGIFDSTRYAFPGSEEKNRPRDLVPMVPPAEAAARQKTYDETLARLIAEVKEVDARKAAIEPEFRAVVGIDGSFEAQKIAMGPGIPWGYFDGARVTASSQSPYTNVYPTGSRGISLPNNAANNAIVQTLPVNRKPETHDRVYYNLDFRFASGGNGTYRIYLGHGPGQSAAVELYFNAHQFFVRSGDAHEPVRELREGVWYNLQVVADLDARTYSGTVGLPGELTRFSGKAFSSGWDGNLDCTFIDGYGQIPGHKPASDVDNLAVSDAPFPPPDEPSAGSASDRSIEAYTKVGTLRAALGDLDARRAVAEQA